MRGCCRGFLQQLHSKGEFSPLKHPEKEASKKIAGGKPPPPRGEQDAAAGAGMLWSHHWVLLAAQVVRNHSSPALGGVT